jgi:glycosyltransferase involved in cell wall biosynthesis
LNPFFSILIPTYNRSLLVLESIHSVLVQSFTDFELIIVDDGSTDDTEAVVNTISSAKLIYFKKSNQERGAARNFGIKKAKGKYVVFMDSDDRMMDNHLETLYTHLKQQQEDFIATKYLFFKDGKKSVSKDVKRLTEGYYNFKTFLIGNPLACCFTIRRENPDLILFREELDYVIMEDWIFLMENLYFSRLYLIDEITMAMRDHDNRSMRGSAGKIIGARRNASDYLVKSLQFSPEEERILTGSSNYFCAVHSYIGGETKAGFHYLLKSIGLLGISLKVILLLFKLCFKAIWTRSKKES